MRRLARLFRIADGIFLLSSLVLCFLPVLSVTQENYPEKSYSAFYFVKQLFGQEKEALLSGEQTIVVLVLILLPLLLSVAMGIVGIAGSIRQILSGIGSLIVAVLLAAFCWKTQVLWPERLNDAQDYQTGYGFYLYAALAGVLVVFGVLALVFTPRLSKKKKAGKAAEYESSLQRNTLGVKAVASQTAGRNRESQEMLSGAGRPRGVLVGLSGSYQGAEIPFADGETLKLGRDNSNDLVFQNSARVSRFHCMITWLAGEGKFQIVDQSSNGSFIDGREECLPQNIAIYLEPGTILAIGSEENRFRLE